MPKKSRITSVILAAGKGTRMCSDLPKALQPICGDAMLGWLLKRAEEIGSEKIVVVGGYGFDRVRAYVEKRASRVPVTLVCQKEQLGSGHAVLQARAALKGFSGSVFVFYCDTPLIRAETVKSLLADHRQNSTDCTLLSVELDNPFGYGRIKRGSSGSVEAIVEENDATDEEKKIAEINVGAYVFSCQKLFEGLGKIKKNPLKKEYYLTDLIGIFSAEGKVEAVLTADREEVLGVNSQKDLAVVERIAQQRILERWMESGVRVKNPQATSVDADVKIGPGTVLLPGCLIEEGSVIGRDCVIGPSARIRGGSRIGNRCTVGNFVEVVRSVIGDETQVKHLSYLGDARLGSRVNVGAGTITANYDGKNKHQTLIKDGAHIGSGTVLVAPVRIGKKAVTGAGAVVTRNHHVKDGQTVAGVPARIFSKGLKKS